MATGAIHLRATMPFGVHVTTQSITHLTFRYEEIETGADRLVPAVSWARQETGPANFR